MFSKNYKLYKELTGDGNQNVEIWKTYFINSSILDDVQRCLLYFNLPFDEIIRDEVKPTLLFERDLRTGGAKGTDFLGEMLNTFEQAKGTAELARDGRSRLANIILLKVPNGQ
jgi:hypothetical protein